MGRPLSYHPDLLPKLLEGIKKSCSLTQTAAFAGVPPRTLMGWVTQGDKEWHDGKETSLAELSREIQRARAEKSMELESHGLEKDPTMPKWLLSKCFRGDYSEHAEMLEDILAHVNKLRVELENVKNNKINHLNAELVEKDVDNG